jgi:hypothetical protein
VHRCDSGLARGAALALRRTARRLHGCAPGRRQQRSLIVSALSDHATEPAIDASRYPIVHPPPKLVPSGFCAGRRAPMGLIGQTIKCGCSIWVSDSFVPAQKAGARPQDGARSSRGPARERPGGAPSIPRRARGIGPVASPNLARGHQSFPGGPDFHRVSPSGAACPLRSRPSFCQSTKPRV